MEVYVLVERKKNVMLHIGGFVAFVVGALMFLLAMAGEVEFFMFAIIGIMLGWFLRTRNFEYEYSYFDGDFRFARIINRSKRDNLRGYTAEELITIAPIEDRSVYQYINNAKLKTLDYTSGQADAKCYVMVAKSDEGLHVIKFEPDEKYLDAVCIKYRQKVVR